MTKGIKSIKRISAVSCVILFTVYLTVFGQSARESAARGLDICFGVILTTVFPFSVASSLLLSSGACDILGRTAFYPLGRLFGLSESGAGLLLPGLIGGFPAGAAGAAELYKSYAALRSELDSAERKLLAASLGTEDASALSACLESIHTANARIDASDYNAQVRRFLYRYDNGFTRMLANLAGVDLPAAFA